VVVDDGLILVVVLVVIEVVVVDVKVEDVLKVVLLELEMGSE